MVSRMARFDSNRGRQRGFSYLWVLLLVALMGVGMTLTAEVYRTTVQRQQEKELIFIGHQFREALRRYAEAAPAGTPHPYPDALEDLLRDSRSVAMRRHLRRIYVDPLTGKAEWGMIRVGGKIVGIHSLSPRLPLKQSGFDASEQSFANAESYSDWAFTYPADLMVKTDGAALPPNTVPGVDHAK